MASPPVLTPAGTTGWNLQKWEKNFEPATYQKMKFIPIIEEGERLYGQLNVRKAARVTASILAQGADGDVLTVSNIIGSPIAIVPAGNYVKIQWSENEDAQIDFDIDAKTRSEIEMALAESTEQGALDNVGALTQIMSQAGVDAAMLRQGVGRLAGNTNGRAMPGDGGPTVYGIFSHTQYPNLVAIPEVNSAEMRGDSENPYVKGVWVKGFGFMLVLSTVVKQDANGWHNCLFIAEAFKISWNVRSRIKRQDFDLTNKLIVFNNLGSNVQHDLRAIALRTTASAL